MASNGMIVRVILLLCSLAFTGLAFDANNVPPYCRLLPGVTTVSSAPAKQSNNDWNSWNKPAPTPTKSSISSASQSQPAGSSSSMSLSTAKTSMSSSSASVSMATSKSSVSQSSTSTKSGSQTTTSSGSVSTSSVTQMSTPSNTATSSISATSTSLPTVGTSTLSKAGASTSTSTLSGSTMSASTSSNSAATSSRPTGSTTSMSSVSSTSIRSTSSTSTSLSIPLPFPLPPIGTPTSMSSTSTTSTTISLISTPTTTSISVSLPSLTTTKSTGTATTTASGLFTTATLACSPGTLAFNIVLTNPLGGTVTFAQFAGTTYAQDNSYGAIYMTDGSAGQPADAFGLVGTTLIACHNNQAYTVASYDTSSLYPVVLDPPGGTTGTSNVIVTAVPADVGDVLTFKTAKTGDMFTYVCGTNKYFQVGNLAGDSVTPPCTAAVVSTEYILIPASS